MGKKSLEGAQSIKKIFPDKRDRSLCKHNMNGYCVEFQCKCENRNCASFEDFTKPKTFVKCKPKLKPFDGIKYVDITLIKLKNPDKNPPLEFQIKQTKELFEKEKGVNIPITVACKEDYYLLVMT